MFWYVLLLQNFQILVVRSVWRESCRCIWVVPSGTGVVRILLRSRNGLKYGTSLDSVCYGTLWKWHLLEEESVDLLYDCGVLAFTWCVYTRKSVCTTIVGEFADWSNSYLGILGVLMWELFTGGKTPYPTFSNAQVLQEVGRVCWFGAGLCVVLVAVCRCWMVIAWKNQSLARRKCMTWWQWHGER